VQLRKRSTSLHEIGIKKANVCASGSRLRYESQGGDINHIACLCEPNKIIRIGAR
jgi:hypothetical protein